jgi:hypothetical protein
MSRPIATSNLFRDIAFILIFAPTQLPTGFIVPAQCPLCAGFYHAAPTLEASSSYEQA